MLKGTKVYSITRSKCPRCMEGEIYPDKNPYRFKTMTDFNPRCSVCDQNFEPEPNFYYGAMYVSYALGVALPIAVFIISKMVFQYELLQSFFAIIAALILLMPLLIRLSRNIWINLFISFDQKASGQKSD